MCYLPRRVFGFSLLSSLLAIVIYLSHAGAATLQLTWIDNSSDENGFNIERKLGLNGVYAQIATVGVNVTSYTDTNLADATTYCYRVDAFNGAGISSYSPEVCGTTPAQPVQSFNLTVVTQGSGTVTSSPAGIDCGATCAASFASGSSVALMAVPASGYSFAGWSGDSDCADGNVTMNSNKSCTATFATTSTTTAQLTVKVVGTVSDGGTGNGTVTSRPEGINCGTTCSANFAYGASVTLIATPASGSIFTGWSGDSDCADGSVTMNGNKSCTATFQLSSQVSSGYLLSVSLSGSGTGKVTSDPPRIDCGTSCSAQFPKGSTVNLMATPALDSFFSGWRGDSDCSDATLTMKSAKSCEAVFTKRIPSNIGIYRPSTGTWYLTTTGTGTWYGCDVDRCIGPFGDSTDLPLSGDWNGSGKANLGVYGTEQKTWRLDTSGTLTLQVCTPDSCPDFTVAETSSSPQIPVTGVWNGSGKDTVGIYQLAPNPKGTKIARQPNRQWSQATISEAGEAEGHIGYWYLERNANGTWDGCKSDRCLGPFGGTGDVPVVGDWNGNGVAKIGVYDPETGMWDLDFNSNGRWNGCGKDRCLGPFGTKGDIPVTGDWDGGGTFKIGVFRPQTGEWFLDLNGNGQWDGPNVDKYVAGFGQDGDLPVVGKW